MKRDTPGPAPDKRAVKQDTPGPAPDRKSAKPDGALDDRQLEKVTGAGGTVGLPDTGGYADENIDSYRTEYSQRH